MSEPITATDAWDVVFFIKQKIGTYYFSKNGYDSIEDQTHALKEEEDSESGNDAFEKIGEIGEDTTQKM